MANPVCTVSGKRKRRSTRWSIGRPRAWKSIISQDGLALTIAVSQSSVRARIRHAKQVTSPVPEPIVESRGLRCRRLPDHTSVTPARCRRSGRRLMMAAVRQERMVSTKPDACLVNGCVARAPASGGAGGHGYETRVGLPTMVSKRLRTPIVLLVVVTLPNPSSAGSTRQGQFEKSSLVNLL